MRRRQPSNRAVSVPTFLGVILLVLTACRIGPLRISSRAQPTEQPAILLRRCDEARDVLCILSFGLEPPDQMEIVLLASAGLPSELEARAAWNGEAGSYPCIATNAEATLFSCRGAAIPLGSAVHLDVAVASSNTVIASGDFALNGVALPTLSSGPDLQPTDIVTITPRPTRTPGPGAATPTSTP
jgi:hypothetical protein